MGGGGEKQHDNPLALARRQLDDAIRVFADRQPVWRDGVCDWSDSIYVRLRWALRGSVKAANRRVADSRAPCHTSVLALLVTVDQTVAGWQDGAGTVDRLNRLRERSWRPEDCDLLRDHTTQLGKWTADAVELLGDAPVEVALRLPCPACGRKFVYKLSHGDTVRSWALRVGENGARCLGCGAKWATEQLEFLATLLNCPPLPGS